MPAAAVGVAILDDDVVATHDAEAVAVVDVGGFLGRQVAEDEVIFAVGEQVRSVHHDLEREVTAAASEVATPEAPPSAVAQAHEAWERLLALCPPAHQPLLRMRQEGLPLAEIARRSGLHESSVRRIFYDLSRQFVGASRQQASAGD